MKKEIYEHRGAGKRAENISAEIQNETQLAKKTLILAPSNLSGRVAKVVALLFCGIALAAMALRDAAGHDSSTTESKVTVVFDHALPNVPGKSLKGVLVEYPPGGSTPAHTHPLSAFIYATVLEGAIRSGVNGGPVKVYHVGDNFYEESGSHHDVSANASQTEPARLLAVFVVDSSAKNLVTPDK